MLVSHIHVSSPPTSNTFEPRHEKLCLKIFVGVIPKEGLADRAPPILLWVWHRLRNVICGGCRVWFYSQCLACQSFFGYDNDKEAHFLMTRLIWQWVTAKARPWATGSGAMTLTLDKSYPECAYSLRCFYFQNTCVSHPGFAVTQWTLLFSFSHFSHTHWNPDLTILAMYEAKISNF